MGNLIPRLEITLWLVLLLQVGAGLWIHQQWKEAHAMLQELHQDLPRVLDHDNAVDATHTEILNEIDRKCIS